MKKKSIIIIGAILLLLIGLTVCFIFKDNDHYTGEKFELESKYYNEGNLISKTSDEVNTLINNKENFVLFTYNNYCSLPIPCEDIFSQSFKDLKIDAINITFEDFKNTELYNTVKLAPSIIIIKEGQIVGYLHADKDKDLEKYQDTDKFISWLKEYIITK